MFYGYHASTDLEPSDDSSRFFKGPSGVQLYTYSYPVDEPKAIVYLVHGLGEYSDRPGYLALYKALNDAQFTVYALDHQGHGRSKGDRGFMLPDFSAAKDYVAYVKSTSANHPDTPKFVLGHSMGGAITAYITALHPTLFEGVILSGPAIGVSRDPNLAGVLKAIMPALSMVVPQVAVPLVDASEISRNDEACKRYTSDPLIFLGGLKLGVAADIKNMGDFAFDCTSNFTLPILMFHGTADKIVWPGGTDLFFNKIMSTKKALIHLPQWKHEPWEEPEVDILYTNIIDFYNSILEHKPFSVQEGQFGASEIFQKEEKSSE